MLKEIYRRGASFIKDYCETDLDVKENISVVYGGSVKLENAEEILSSSYVDGLLIGGASLNPDNFLIFII